MEKILLLSISTKWSIVEGVPISELQLTDRAHSLTSTAQLSSFRAPAVVIAASRVSPTRFSSGCLMRLEAFYACHSKSSSL